MMGRNDAAGAVRGMGQREVFLQTLVCNVEPGSRLLWRDLGYCRPGGANEATTFQARAAAQASSSAEVCGCSSRHQAVCACLGVCIGIERLLALAASGKGGSCPTIRCWTCWRAQLQR